MHLFIITCMYYQCLVAGNGCVLGAPAGTDYHPTTEDPTHLLQLAQLAAEDPQPAKLATEDPQPAKLVTEDPQPAKLATDDPQPAKLVTDDPQPAQDRSLTGDYPR